MLESGDMAPDFTLPSDRGTQIQLSAQRPACVVLFFYPRDDTSGCTAEAIAFTALHAAFASAGAKVFGLSKDSVAKHAKFRDKHDLGIPLLSDADTDVCETYGVWTQKSMYGKTFFGIERSTFLIDGAGQITRVWRKVKVPGHADAVLGAVTAL